MAKSNQSYLEWLVEKRTETQKSCLKLLLLLKGHPEKFRKAKYSSPAQALVGVAFSLWRAVFLGEKEGTLHASLNDASKFLEKIVRTNSIAFSQEMEANEWTFNYYVSNSRYRLIELSEKRSDLLSEWEYCKRNPLTRWEYNQRKFDEAITKLERSLRKAGPVGKGNARPSSRSVSTS